MEEGDFEGEGMTAEDVVRILRSLNVKFAYMLDGGGSVSTVVYDQLITPKIDNNGTQERSRPNFFICNGSNQLIKASIIKPLFLTRILIPIA